MPKPLLTSGKVLESGKELRHHRAHALCGAYVIGHFVHRYARFFFGKSPDMGFDASTPFFWLFVPHLLLQLSGFGFKLPTKRHPDGNRIWGEYRWHAFFFLAGVRRYCSWHGDARMTATAFATKLLSRFYHHQRDSWHFLYSL
jgi:hypothetical protein